MKKILSKYTVTDILSKQTFEELTSIEDDLEMKKNTAMIDKLIEELSESLDREITPYEEEKILEIVDEFTPVGKNGKYLTDLLPFDYAWKIYEARKKEKTKEFFISW